MVYVALVCAAAPLALVLKWRCSGSRAPYPPGPRRYPFVGSALGVPHDVPIWKGFTSIAERFGRCSIPAGGHQIKDVTIIRYGCAIPEDILNGLRRSEQFRGHLRSYREAVRHLLR